MKIIVLLYLAGENENDLRLSFMFCTESTSLL